MLLTTLPLGVATLLLGLSIRGTVATCALLGTLGKDAMIKEERNQTERNE